MKFAAEPAVALLGSLSLSVTLAQASSPFPGTTYSKYVDSIAAAGARANQSSPPSYPSPWGSGTGDWAEAYEKARAFVKQMTLVEKVNLTTGTGPLGVRDTDWQSAFPAGVTVGSTFDRKLMYERGYAMGAEHKAKGVTVVLGPVAGPLGRTAEGARNWEGFGSDPVLAGIAMEQTVKGIQDAGVVACAKHFIGNEQDHFRLVSETVDYGWNISESFSANIDDATMHEVYLWPFADAVRAGVGSVMCSYNQVNNSYSCQNSYLMNHLLKGELGFEGFVVSDWPAQHAGVSSALAGLDMTMPGDYDWDNLGKTFFGSNLTLSVLNGTVPEWRIDDMATRIMAAFFKVGLTVEQPPINFNSFNLDTYGALHYAAGEEYGYGQINWHVDVRGNHSNIIREVAAKGTVLLKNVNNALPLKKPRFLAIVGEDAGPAKYGPNGCSDRGCDDGTLGMGWGSGTAAYPYMVTPQYAIEAHAIADGTIAQTITDNYAYDEITTLVSQVDATLVFVNADAGEWYIVVDENYGDRNNLTLWGGGEELIKNVTASCNNTIVIMHTPGPVLVSDWYENPNVTAILWAALPGQESGNSIVDILYGDINPAGRTPFTWGKTRSDYGTDVLYELNCQAPCAPQINFQEGKFIDYKAFDKVDVDPIYEFGFGLSYTTFAYSDLNIEKLSVADYTPTTANSTAAPVLGNYSTNLADYQFPQNLTRVAGFLYPWLNSTNASLASEDSTYNDGNNEYIPTGALDGSSQPINPAGGAPGGNPALWDVMYIVNATITNNGTLDGDEVPQLYVSLGGPDDAKVALRNFDRLTIAAGESATFSANLTRRDLSNWDTASQNWVISNYTKTVYVGSSSRKLHLSQTLA
ncbi:MAG: hypothetical protein M1834_004816 [Cirrosporium novae-zelandiae]|nr:MAG: hypothetical protein M1834_004816 [Cirrosporium novae-zelandiae]